MVPEATLSAGDNYPYRHSSVVSMPMSRRSVDSVVTAAGVSSIDVTTHKAAAVAAAMAATNTQSAGSQSASSAAAIAGRRWSTIDHPAGLASVLRRHIQPQNGVTVTGLSSLNDEVLSVSRCCTLNSHCNKNGGWSTSSCIRHLKTTVNYTGLALGMASAQTDKIMFITFYMSNMHITNYQLYPKVH